MRPAPGDQQHLPPHEPSLSVAALGHPPGRRQRPPRHPDSGDWLQLRKQGRHHRRANLLGHQSQHRPHRGHHLLFRARLGADRQLPLPRPPAGMPRRATADCRTGATTPAASMSTRAHRVLFSGRYDLRPDDDPDSTPNRPAAAPAIDRGRRHRVPQLLPLPRGLFHQLQSGGIERRHLHRLHHARVERHGGLARRRPLPGREARGHHGAASGRGAGAHLPRTRSGVHHHRP